MELSGPVMGLLYLYQALTQTSGRGWRANATLSNQTETTPLPPKKHFVDIMLPIILHNLHFSLNAPLKLADG
jgi:hypothetical protein